MARGRFAQEMAQHQIAEERRLMYVAITRAKKHLLFSGSYWAHQLTARKPSRFLTELIEAGIVDGIPGNLSPDTAPPARESELPLWPRDPLGSRRPLLESAAALVTAAQSEAEQGEPTRVALARIRQEMLMAHATPQQVSNPVRIPASSLEQLIADPDAFRSALARPVPRRPHAAALRGTLFHRFVEEQFDVSLPGPVLSIGESEDTPEDALALEDWKEAFLRSEFATPHASGH